MTHKMVVGTIEPQDFQLFNDETALDGTDWDVEIVFRETDAELAGVVAAWLDQDAGTVRVTGVEDMAIGQYHFRFKLTDGEGNEGFVPNVDAAGIWTVSKV